MLGRCFGKKFVVYFPIVNEDQNIWEWDSKSFKNDEIDYKWIATPGFLYKKTFQSGSYAFGLGHRINSLNSSPKIGSFEDMLTAFKGRPYVYLNDQDETKRRNADAELSRITLNAMYKNNGLAIYSKDPKAVKILFKKKITHVKLNFITPYKEQNYTCIVKIDYQ